jgi:hypothetical protein
MRGNQCAREPVPSENGGKVKKVTEKQGAV